MALGIQRRDEIISMTGRAIWEFPGAGKMEQDAIKVNSDKVSMVRSKVWLQQ